MDFLQREIEMALKQKRMKQLDMFKCLPDEIVGKIALRLRAKSCGAMKLLYAKEDIATELFIQRIGKSQIISTVQSDPNQVVERGGVFGEDAFLSRHRRDTVICQTWSEYYVLDVRDISDVLQQNYNPTEAVQKWQDIKSLVRDRMTGKSERTHFFVKFDTIRDFERYLPTEAAEDMVTDDAPDNHKNGPSILNSKLMRGNSNKSNFSASGLSKKSNHRHDEYEKRLQVEAEIEEMQAFDRTDAENRRSMAHITSLFNSISKGMNREPSVVRDRKVV